MISRRQRLLNCVARTLTKRICHKSKNNNSGQSNVAYASPPHTDGSTVFTRLRQYAPHLIQLHGSLGLPKCTFRTASPTVIDRQTDKPRYSVCNNRSHLRCTATLDAAYKQRKTKRQTMTNGKAMRDTEKTTSTEASKTKCHNGLWSYSQKKRLFRRCCHRITNCAEIRTHFLRQKFRNFLATLSRPCFSPVGNSLRAARQQYPESFHVSRSASAFSTSKMLTTSLALIVSHSCPQTYRMYFYRATHTQVRTARYILYATVLAGSVLHSQGHFTYCCHEVRTTFARRAFSVAGPFVWNSLPDYT